jgi:hypothetical protein
MSETIKNQLVQLEALILDKERQINSRKIRVHEWVVMDSNYYSNWRDKQSNKNRIATTGQEIEKLNVELATLKNNKKEIVDKINEEIAIVEQENLLIAQQEEKRMSEMESTSFLDLSD